MFVMALYTRERVVGIEIAKQRGEEIARQWPEIADSYRNGRTRGQIADERRLCELYDIAPQIALVYVSYALEILLRPAERRKLKSSHQSAGGSKGAAGRGDIAWTPGEIRYFWKLVRSPCYARSGGRPNYGAIGRELSRKFRTRRSYQSLKVMNSKLRRGRRKIPKAA